MTEGLEKGPQTSVKTRVKGIRLFLRLTLKGIRYFLHKCIVHTLNHKMKYFKTIEEINVPNKQKIGDLIGNAIKESFLYQTSLLPLEKHD